jgi:hypothetical protein
VAAAKCGKGIRGGILPALKTIKTLQDIDLPKPAEDSGGAPGGDGKAAKKSKKHKQAKAKKAHKKDGGKKDKDDTMDPRAPIAQGQPLQHVARFPNALVPYEIAGRA